MTLRVRSVIFYALASLALVLLVTKAQKEFLPAGLATQIGHNSEALLFALLVAAEIQILRGVSRPVIRLTGIATGAVLLIGLGTLLLRSDLSPTLVTLNEPIIGAGFVLVYLALPRSPAVGVGMCVAVALLVVVFFDTDVRAEPGREPGAAGPGRIGPRRLRPHDPPAPAPGRPEAPPLLDGSCSWSLWCPSCPRLTGRGRTSMAGSATRIDYLQRAAEAFWGWLLVHAFFSYWLGSRWRVPVTGPVELGRQRAVGNTA